MGAAVLLGDPWSFEVNAMKGPGVDEGDQSLDLAREIVVRGGHQTRVHRCRAVSTMGGDGPLNLLVIGRREFRTPTAMAMDVDESRGDDRGYDRHGVIGSTVADGGDLTVVDADPATTGRLMRPKDQVPRDRHRHAANLEQNPSGRQANGLPPFLGRVGAAT